jgi:hypothetical protein
VARPKSIGGPGAGGRALLDRVQFDAAIYYAEEQEKVMKVDVMRLGRMEGIISVAYATEDDSAIAGDRYEAVSGTLVFGPQEVSKTIVIPINDADGWNTPLEFKMRLSNAVNCEIARFLYLSRCKIIDKDCFPTNRFADELRNNTGGSLEETGVPGFDLFMEWCKLNLTYANVLPNSLIALGIDQLENLYFLFTTYLIEYVADDVLGTAPGNPLIIPGSKIETLCAVAALYVVPNGVLNLLNLWKAELGIAQKSRSMLQESLFRKYMNFNQDSRNKCRRVRLASSWSRTCKMLWNLAS